MSINKLSEQELVRQKKVELLNKKNIPAYSETKLENTNWQEVVAEFNVFSKEELEQKSVIINVAGRIVAMRGPFIIINSYFDKIQLYYDKKLLQIEENKDLFELLDLGDIIQAQGVVFKTKTNELSLKVNKLQLLTKALKPLPDKFHGINDVDEKYRKRYLDLISNPETKQVFFTRTKIISLIRQFLDNLNYMEVTTPILQSLLTGASARPFTTFYNSLHANFYLRIATELPLKKLLVGGLDRVYEIGKIFRNEGVDTTHNPEFTSIEFYEAYANLETMMERTEAIFKFLVDKLNIKNKKIVFGEYEIDFNLPFNKFDLVDKTSEILGINLKTQSFEQLKAIAQAHNIKIEKFYQSGHIINALFEEFVEPKLIQPTFVYGHPIEISPLAKKDEKDPRFTQRAELFIAKKEFANMFNELNDPEDQLQRFENQIKEKDLGNEEANEIDYDFVDSLKYGMPPAGGCGIGIDRLVMLLTSKTSIREVILFPQLKAKK
ncbi:lysine--tRNA ligase [Mesomycoplasma hyorhinis]|uniref:Lysine--tRNA ligase n=2 Tax=Mesomycoplasma hyorhinis TaxID=2100 RepID=A0ABM5M5Y8_MESHM|nr:Lysyl-tRNA synthetase 1 [Mesomycoplasma hyorhinis MCLD]AEX14309.1 lysyl-tRNA synthetase [Mesomycoplasma hyorhinis GDL-1]AHA41319.1 lysine--tRNA ligase [Mesomycoplasma hyorhinis DBS 1050]AOD25551.1 lysyl-tRNA synthetase [Mesomycoplasma hyorhinis]TRM84231.1 lysine--tRNA ligase [Sulfolobus sp. A20-N-F6]